MRTIFTFIFLAVLTTNHFAQEISFNSLKEAALGNVDVLKVELIENGWTMEKIKNEDAYGYAYNFFETTTAFVYFGESGIMCRSQIMLNESSLEDIYLEIKAKCKYEGVKTFKDPPLDYIFYTHNSGAEFKVYSEEDVFCIQASSSNH